MTTLNAMRDLNDNAPSLKPIKKEKSNILYLDDEPENLDIFRIAFKREYNIFLAENAKDAFEVLENQDIHLIITDHQMPEMTGTEFLKKTLQHYPGIVRIILTGYADIGAIMEAVNDCNIYKYITKPWDRGDMKLTIEKALENRHLKQENTSLVSELQAINQNLEKIIEKKMEEVNAQQEEIKAQNETLQEQYLKLEQRNQMITAVNQTLNKSIQYARQIQHAMLPKDSQMSNLFEDFFVVNIPRDIVSGDFYWLGEINEQTSFLALADCTGHGVPGALMSMMGHMLFNKVINEKHLLGPAQILETINENIFKDLQQDESGNSDGMDVALCRFDKKPEGGYILTFSAAKRHVYIVRNGELFELKGSRKSLGGMQFEDDAPFGEEIFDLQKGDLLYMSSDGWTDSPNEHRERYGTRRLKEALLAYASYPMEEQEILLMQDLARFKGETAVRDDILMIGLKI